MFPLLNHLVVCRCCLGEQPPHYHNIYDNRLSVELMAVVPNLHLDPNDRLSDVICELCLQQVREALAFRRRCEDSEQVLQARYEQWCRTVDAGDAVALEDVLECLEREVGSLEEQSAPPAAEAEATAPCQVLPKPVACVAPLMEPADVDFGTLSFAESYQCDTNDAVALSSSWQACSTLNTPTHLAASLECAVPPNLEAMTTKLSCLPQANNTADATTKVKAKTRSPGMRRRLVASLSGKSNTPKSLHPCSECEKKFTRNFQLKQHMISVHNLGDGLRYQCDNCHKIFASRHSLRYHVKSLHSTERPFICEHCDRRFVLRTQLVSHLRTHTGESKPRILACAKCSKTWPTKSDLRTHMRSHDPDMERPFKCDRCEKAFFTRGHLSSHILVHTGEKPYACEYCDRSYQSVGNLNNHMVRQHGDILAAELEGDGEQHTPISADIES